MASAKSLLAQIVADLDALHEAYGKSGLTAADGASPMAAKLLGSGEDVYRFRRDFLLVDALIRNRVGRALCGGGTLRHVVAFGGNNVGKSTVINIMLGAKAAGTSPQGGFTRQAQAFVIEPAGATVLFGGNPFAFRRLRPAEAADDEASDQFRITPLPCSALPPDIALWDTPDCDAIESPAYMAAVVEAVSSADLLLYVTTEEKSAVLHLVEWFLLLHAAGIPALEVLNRTRLVHQAAIIAGERERFFPLVAARLGIPPPDPQVIGLKYLVEGEEQDLWDPELHPQALALRETAFTRARQVDSAAAARAALAFAVARIGALLEPARMELAAGRQWAGEVDAAIERFVDIYRQKYLTSDTVIEPFTRLNIEILKLLDPDIPGLKHALAAISWAARWPAKIIVASARHVIRMVTGDRDNAPPTELVAYRDAHLHVLNQLDGVIHAARRAPRHHPFWDALETQWNREIEPLSARFAEEVRRHMAETDQTVKQAARDIHEQLRTRPAVLNTLRGVKVVANVGGVAAGFMIPHAGSLVYDLIEEAIITPVILGGIDVATSSAVQAYVSNRRRELVAKLEREAVAIAETLYRAPLDEIAAAARRGAGALGVDAAIVERLPQALQRLQERFHEQASGQ